MGVLSAALGRYARLRPLDDLKERLLHALTGHIPCDGNVLALLRDLVDLIDIDDAILRPLHIVVRRLDQL